jgi:hypothetical protein
MSHRSLPTADNPSASHARGIEIYLLKTSALPESSRVANDG